jgi:peptidoglycan hydrolase-like protein with peptidoglycan-binding domain
MGRKSKSVVRDFEDDERRPIRPGAAVLSLFALTFAIMITWNAFFGEHQGRSAQDLLGSLPKGATTRVVVRAPGKSSKSISISYDARVEDAQRELSATGHYRGLVDGVNGKQTELAVRKYQADNGLPVTGDVSKELLNHIRYTRKVVAASEFTGSLPSEPIKKPRKVRASPPALPQATPAQLPGDRRVREVQTRLKKLDYEIAVVTGTPDPATRSAILQFQLDHDLTMDGAVTPALLAALKVAEAELQATAE